MKKLTILFVLFLLIIVGRDTNKNFENISKYSPNSLRINSNILSVENLIGRWCSIEEDHKIELIVLKNNVSEKFELKILNSNEPNAIFSQGESNNEFLVFVTPDNLINYTFSIYEDKISMLMTSNNSSDENNNELRKVTGAIRPWFIERKSQ